MSNLDKKAWTRVAVVFIFVVAICLGVVFGVINAKKNAITNDVKIESGDKSGDLVSGDKVESGEK